MSFEPIYQLKNTLDKGLPEKDWLDKHLFKYITPELSPWGRQRQTNQRVVVCAKTFLTFVLPFSELYFESLGATVKYVPSNYVLGGHYVGHCEVTSDRLDNLLDTLDDNAEENGHPEQARYIQVGDFPVYRPYEGKNRISLYRSAQRPIKALVKSNDYPAAEDLKLLAVKPFKDCFALEYTGKERVSVESKHQLISSRSGRIVSIIAFNESISALEGYGVSWGNPIYSISAPLKKRICRIKVAHRFYRA